MPFLFRNKANKKWVSFENDSTTYNNRNITITDCKVCEKNTVPANMRILVKRIYDQSK